MKLEVRVSLALAATLAWATCGMAPQALAQSQSPALIPVTISWNKVAGQIIAPVALAKGFGKEYGVALKLISFAGGADSIQTTVTGDSDGAFAATVPTGPSLIANGAPIKSVLVYAYGGDRLALVTLKSSGITSPSQLAGKRVAGPLANTAQQLAEAIIVAAGLDVKSVGMVNMDYPDIPAALRTKQVDAGVFAEPILSAFLAQEPTAVVLARGGKYVGAQGAFFMSDKIRKAPNDAAYKLYLTLAKTAQYIRQKGADSDEIAQILANATGISLALAKGSAAGTVFDPRIKPWIVAQTQKDLDFFVRIAKLKPGFPVNDIFDVSLQARALKEHPELFSDLDAYLKAQGATPEQLQRP